MFLSGKRISNHEFFRSTCKCIQICWRSLSCSSLSQTRCILNVSTFVRCVYNLSPLRLTAISGSLSDRINYVKKASGILCVIFVLSVNFHQEITNGDWHKFILNLLFLKTIHFFFIENEIEKYFVEKNQMSEIPLTFRSAVIHNVGLQY